MRQEAPTIKKPFDPRVTTVEQLATLLDIHISTIENLVAQSPSLYTSFKKRKPNGGYRTICPPSLKLRIVQRQLLDVLQKRIRYPRWMTGSVPKRSIFVHAQPHLNQKMVATYDILNFFPNTKIANICLVMERLGFCGAALDAVLALVMKDDELPQGGPASGFLANLAIEPADRRIDAICRKHKLHFTRYVDDIAISGSLDLRAFQDVIQKSVESCGYKLATDKIRYMRRSERQVVTKLCVNEKLRPTREFISDVKSTIWDCVKNGASLTALERGLTVKKLKNSLTGKVAHISKADQKVGCYLKRKLHGIDWSPSKKDAEKSGARDMVESVEGFRD